MRVTVVIPPAPVVTYADAVARLRIASDASEQADVEAMIAAATAMFDAETGWLGRAIGEQTLEARFDSFAPFHSRPLVLPYPPIAAVVSVKYIDPTGVEQTCAPEQYYQAGEELWPAPGASWPSARVQREAVRIQYSAGYDVVPASIKAAILLAVGDMYRFRETIALTTVESLPSAASIENLLGPLRKYR